MNKLSKPAPRGPQGEESHEAHGAGTGGRKEPGVGFLSPDVGGGREATLATGASLGDPALSAGERESSSYGRLPSFKDASAVVSLPANDQGNGVLDAQEQGSTNGRSLEAPAPTLFDMPKAPAWR